MTLREALEFGKEELEKAHSHDPEGNTSFLLRHLIGEDPRSAVLKDVQRFLTSGEEEKFKNMLERRRQHEPAWYITNEAYFWKDRFVVDDRVLIPRPETELLVEKVLEYVDSLSSKRLFSVIDVGTGSGAIAISLYKELRDRGKVSEFSASDISPDAIAVAEENANRLGVEEGIQFLVGDALDPLTKKVDIIVGNPPYVPTETVGGLSYDIHHFEPRIALDGGLDGLEVHKRILSQSVSLLNPGGSIFLEIGHNQGKMASSVGKKYFPGADINVVKDYAGLDRILVIRTAARKSADG